VLKQIERTDMAGWNPAWGKGVKSAISRVASCKVNRSNPMQGESPRVNKTSKIHS